MNIKKINKKKNFFFYERLLKIIFYNYKFILINFFKEKLKTYSLKNHFIIFDIEGKITLLNFFGILAWVHTIFWDFSINSRSH